MLGSWKKQFAFRKIYPLRKDPTVFIISQWQKNKTEPNLKYLIYRTLIMLIFLVTWIISTIREAGPGKWPIFLTNWGYSICTFQATLSFIMLLCSYLGSIYDKPNLTKPLMNLYPIYWVLNATGTPAAFAISTIYWSVIFDAKKSLDAMNYFMHGNNSIMMFIDLWMVAHPTRFLHFVYPTMLGFTYSIFNCIYYFAGGTSNTGTKYIYKIVDWSNPGLALAVCLGVMVYIIILHMITMLISMARTYLKQKYCSKKLNITMTETKRQAAYVNEAILTDIV